jgi:hypothetical protein
MGAIYLLNNIVVTEPAMSKLEAEQHVLNELHRMKRFKEASFLTIRRAIKIQKKRVKRNLY